MERTDFEERVENAWSTSSVSPEGIQESRRLTLSLWSEGRVERAGELGSLTKAKRSERSIQNMEAVSETNQSWV